MFFVNPFLMVDKWKMLILSIYWYLNILNLRAIPLHLHGTWLHDILCFMLGEYALRKLAFHLLSNWMGYDRGDGYRFDFELNGILYGSKFKGKLSSRSYPIQFERKGSWWFGQTENFQIESPARKSDGWWSNLCRRVDSKPVDYFGINKYRFFCPLKKKQV